MEDLTLFQLVAAIIASGLVSSAFAAGGAYYAVKTRLDYLEQNQNREIARHDREIGELRKEDRALHKRITDLAAETKR